MSAPALQPARVAAGTGLALAAGAAWVALAALHDTGGGDLTALCGVTGLTGAVPLAALWAVWALMGAAMMLPTAAPAIDLHARLVSREAGAGLRIAAFVAGYLAAWTGAALPGALAQAALAGAAGTLPADAASGAILLGAGLYQRSRLKAACLAACRSPLGFFLRHWREGAGGAARLGLLHGLVCVGCCWALMGLMLVAGAMNIAWMALLGLLMGLEKWAPGAPAIGRQAGLAMALAGAALLARAALA